MGKPYHMGAAGPGAWDCSGLVMVSFSRIGIRLPHSAAGIGRMGHRIALSAARPGDVLVWGSYHVAIYLGGGRIVEAPHSGVPVHVVAVWGRPFAVRIV